MRERVHGRGRPLRFLALVGVGWVSLRVAMLWPQTGAAPEALDAVIPIAVAAPALRPQRAAAIPGAPAVWPAPPNLRAPAIDRSAAQVPLRSPAAPAMPVSTQATMMAVAMPPPAPPAATPPPPMPERLPPLPDRWSASAWFVARPGTGLGAAPGGSQLGGSQAGVRLAYMFVPRARIAGFTRLATPLKGRGREGALGLEWQPSGAPVRLVLEQRFALDEGRGGPGAGVVAGLDRQVPAGFRLEAYGQAGAVRRARTEPYADGAARLTRPIGTPSGLTLALGAGMWGAVQRDAARLDIGPSAVAALPIAGKAVRLSVDWRQRVAGAARPGSGLALTLGSDF
jgi:hypothetical protein